MELDTCNLVNAKTLEEMLDFMLNERWKNPDDRLPAVMIWGPPGVGKSAIVRSVAEKNGCAFIDLRLAQMEAIDIKGLPVPEQDGVHWKISSAYPRDEQSRGILFLDELSACDRTIQTAAYELILDRKLGDDYRLPDNWLIVAAGNRIEDSASAISMSSALANRFLHVELEYNTGSWMEWAMRSNIHGAVSGLIKFKPQLLADMDEDSQNLERGFPTPRSWERTSLLLNRLSAGEVPEVLLQAMVCGLVGNSAGLELISFYNLYNEMQKIVEIMLDPASEIHIPADIAKRYALTSALSRSVWNDSIASEEVRLAGFFRISLALPGDFAAMSMLDALEIGKQQRKDTMKLITHSDYKTWIAKHSKALRGRSNNA
ncbi:MAG: AAA family ATPase [Lentisphaeria bacterium]|nr:AAA family ATPase [Lentisphaeria bacterium]